LIPFGIAAAPDNQPSLSSIDCIATVSIVDYFALVLCINFFLSPSSGQLQENPSLVLVTLVRRLSKLLLLVYNYFQQRYDNITTVDNMPTASPPTDVDGDSVDTTGLGFDKIDGIFIRFGPHWKNLTVNKLLDVAYSQYLSNLDELFSDGSSRTQLKSTVIKLIRKQLVEFISIRATSTPDKTKIAPIINELFFNTKSPRHASFPVRTVQELAASLTAAVALGHTTMDLFVDTGRLNFIDEPNPYNFDHFKLNTPFPTSRPPTAAATAPALDVNALVAALAAHTAALSSSTVPAGTLAPAGGALAPPAGSLPVTNIFN